MKLVAPFARTILIEGRVGHRQGTDRAGDSPVEPALTRAVRRVHCAALSRTCSRASSSVTSAAVHRRDGARIGRFESAAAARSFSMRSARSRSPPGEAAGSSRRNPSNRVGVRSRSSSMCGSLPQPTATSSRWCRGEIPRGSVLPAQRRTAHHAAAARSLGRTSRCCWRFSSRSFRGNRVPPLTIEPGAVRTLQAYPWPETSASCGISAKTPLCSAAAAASPNTISSRSSAAGAGPVHGAELGRTARAAAGWFPRPRQRRDAVGRREWKRLLREACKARGNRTKARS